MFHFSSVLLLAVAPGGLPVQQASQGEIARYSEQARQALAAKNWEEAGKALEKLAELTPNVPEVEGDLGLVYYSQGRILEAVQAFERALKLNPKMAQARLLLGLCDVELGQSKGAAAILEPAFRHPPDSKTGRLIGLGLERAYAGLGEYAKALEVFDELLRRYPNDSEILFNASRFYASRSYEMMRRLIQAAPDSVWVHYANAEVRESLQQYDLAIAEYGKVLEMEPRLPGVYFRIGRVILSRSKDPKAIDEAMREFEQELAIAPQNAESEYEIGEICRQRSQFESALQHFSKAVQYQPQFEEAQIGLARALIDLSRPQEAVTHLLEAVRLNPGNEIPHFLLASAYKALGDSASQQKELALFQRLRAGGSQASARPPAAPASPEVTPQTLGSEVPPQR